jgi:hypothetical protein
MVSASVLRVHLGWVLERQSQPIRFVSVQAAIEIRWLVHNARRANGGVSGLAGQITWRLERVGRWEG